MELFYHIIRFYNQEDYNRDVDFFCSEIVLTKFSTLTRTSSTFCIIFDTALSKGSFRTKGTRDDAILHKALFLFYTLWPGHEF